MTIYKTATGTIDSETGYQTYHDGSKELIASTPEARAALINKWFNGVDPNAGWMQNLGYLGTNTGSGGGYGSWGGGESAAPSATTPTAAPGMTTKPLQVSGGSSGGYGSFGGGASAGGYRAPSVPLFQCHARQH